MNPIIYLKRAFSNKKLYFLALIIFLMVKITTGDILHLLKEFQQSPIVFLLELIVYILLALLFVSSVHFYDLLRKHSLNKS